MNRLKALSADDAAERMLLKPCHMLMIGQHVNDTYVSRWEVDLQEQSICFDWKDYFTSWRQIASTLRVNHM